MASLEKRPHGYRAVFMFRGAKIARSLRTKNPKQAKATLARMEDTLRRVELGTLSLPEGTDIATFLLSDGSLTSRPCNDKPLTLTEIFDDYFANLPAGANEETTISGMRTHQRHLERLLGSDFPVQRLTTSDLQGFIEKRSKEEGLLHLWVVVADLLCRLNAGTRVFRHGLSPQGAGKNSLRTKGSRMEATHPEPDALGLPGNR